MQLDKVNWWTVVGWWERINSQNGGFSYINSHRFRIHSPIVPLELVIYALDETSSCLSLSLSLSVCRCLSLCLLSLCLVCRPSVPFDPIQSNSHKLKCKCKLRVLWGRGRVQSRWFAIYHGSETSLGSFFLPNHGFASV